MPIAARRVVEATDYIVDGVEVEEDVLLEEDNEDTVADHSSALQSGWESALKSAKTDKSFTTEFRFTDEPQLVKFLDSAPFASFDQHWIERPGKKSFVCLGEAAECPLCGIGDSPRPKAAFSIVNLSAEEPVVEILLTSPTLTRQLASFDQDAKTGPLDRIFWSMARQGKGPKTIYTILPVKARDLSEDWGADQSEVESSIDRFEPLTPRVISFTPRNDMLEISREISSR